MRRLLPRRLALPLVAAGLAGACAGATIPRVSDSDVERARTTTPEITRASLEHGRSLYLARCSSCHQAFAPGSRDEASWTFEVAEMRTLAGLDAEEEGLILSYLRTFARP